MNTKAEQTEGTSSTDIAILMVAMLLVAAGIVAFYYFSTWSSATRILILLAAMVAAGGIGALTGPGRLAREFLAEAQFELRKVIWPARDETIRTTGVIIVVVILLSILLGLIDLTLKWVVLDHLLKIGQ